MSLCAPDPLALRASAYASTRVSRLAGNQGAQNVSTLCVSKAVSSECRKLQVRGCETREVDSCVEVFDVLGHFAAHRRRGARPGGKLLRLP